MSGESFEMSGMSALRVSSVEEKVQVAAIDFGTTYSGYAFSFRTDYLEDPLRVVSYNWAPGGGRSASMKTSSCALFKPSGEFDSFGYEAEDRYAELALEDNHTNWFFFKRFKMILYEKPDLSKVTMLFDDKGKEMNALDVFSESIRYLKNHLLKTCADQGVNVRSSEIFWVLTVPAIWNDTAKQFMRQAAVQAGISSEKLTLALEPEAASLFCKHIPVSKATGNVKRTGNISCFKPGKKYLVLDAGGGTIDITVHETQKNGAVREMCKANGGAWGGTTVDEAFIDFLVDIAGTDVMEAFQRDHKDDFLDLMRDFEIKKKGFDPEMDKDQKITFKIPLSFHETFEAIRGQNFSKSLLMTRELKDDLTFARDKLRVPGHRIRQFFSRSCHKIVKHLQDVLGDPRVKGTETILMVGGFSESKMLQQAVKDAFPGMTFIIPAEASLAVLKGAVIFGHNPQVIETRVCKFTYGICCNRDFIEGHHPFENKMVFDGVEKCIDCFDKHVEIGEEVAVGKCFAEKTYCPASRTQQKVKLRIFMSDERNPEYIDDLGCDEVGNAIIDVSELSPDEDRNFVVRLIYGDTELGVEASVKSTGKSLKTSFEFLG